MYVNNTAKKCKTEYYLNLINKNKGNSGDENLALHHLASRLMVFLILNRSQLLML